jgi:hypothetical protein
VRPVAAFLAGTAKQVDTDAPDRIFVAPGFMTIALRYLTRDSLVYEGLDAEADLALVVLSAEPAKFHTWVVVDYRWPAFAAMSHDSRFNEETIEAGGPRRTRLFRVAR